MFTKWEDCASYIVSNCPDSTDGRLDEDHWDLACDSTICNGVVRGFVVVAHGAETRPTKYGYSEKVPNGVTTFYFRCPVCKSYKIWIGYWATKKIEAKDADGKIVEKSERGFYRVASLPNENEDITALPSEPPSLRTAYIQAVRCMNVGAYMASAVMFRRSLQILLRDVLKVKCSSNKLFDELKAAVGMSYDGVTLTDGFFKDAKILKKAGDQAAHPDKDADLLDFTEQDAIDLQFIFRRLVAEMFEVPEALRRVRGNITTNRKINT